MTNQKSLGVTSRVAKLEEYWELSSAYNRRPNNLVNFTMGDLLHKSADLAGACNTTWGRLEHHTAILLDRAVMGKPKAKPSDPLPTSCTVTLLQARG